MANDPHNPCLTKWRTFAKYRFLPRILTPDSELNIHAMRMGPGKHLKGLTLMGGIVKPEEFDYFHEVFKSLVRWCMCTDDLFS